jgi:hypothetical protein
MMQVENNIPWKRLTAEGAAIVVSILLAFWIDAWWDDRAERTLVRESLEAIEVELLEADFGYLNVRYR